MEATLLDYIFGFITGAFVGFVGGYSGLGGAPVIIIILVACLGYSQHQAQGIILAVLMGPMSLPAVLSMWDIIKKNYGYILSSVLFYMVFSYFGGSLAYLLDSQILRIVFSFAIITLGTFWIGRSFNSNTDKNREGIEPPKPILPISLWIMGLIGALMGIIGGMLGITAGILLIPILTGIFKLDKNIARAISLAILLPPVSAGAVFRYHLAGDLDWIMIAVLFFGYFITNYFGAKLGSRHTLKQFSIAFGCILMIMGVLNIMLSFWMDS